MIDLEGIYEGWKHISRWSSVLFMQDMGSSSDMGGNQTLSSTIVGPQKEAILTGFVIWNSNVYSKAYIKVSPEPLWASENDMFKAISLLN